MAADAALDSGVAVPGRQGPELPGRGEQEAESDVAAGPLAGGRPARAVGSVDAGEPRQPAGLQEHRGQRALRAGQEVQGLREDGRAGAEVQEGGPCRRPSWVSVMGTRR